MRSYATAQTDAEDKQQPLGDAYNLISIWFQYGATPLKKEKKYANSATLVGLIWCALLYRKLIVQQ